MAYQERQRRASDVGRLPSQQSPATGAEGSTGTGHTWPPGLPFDQVLDGARKLDKSALGLLYRRFLPVVYRYALAHVGNSTHAEDVTSETFYAVVDGISGTRAEDEITFTAWVLGIARNKVARHHRTSYARPETSLTVTDIAEPVTVADEADPLGVIIARERWSEVSDALAMLTEEQRTVVIYRCALGYSAEEVGQMLGKPANAIRGLQFRALASLARFMERDESAGDTLDKPGQRARRGHGTAR